jgi:phytoene dehydrogenase-like protein
MWKLFRNTLTIYNKNYLIDYSHIMDYARDMYNINMVYWRAWMGNKKIIIIGAGVSGLSAGCYLQMNGYSTEIFELHSIPGGLCTGWKRKGYTFDGCIHWLCGSNPNSEMHVIWEELQAINGRKVINHDIFIHTYLGSGKSFSVYTDISKLKAEMLREAPEDKELINEFMDAIFICSASDLPALKAQDLFNLFDGLKFVFKEHALVRMMAKWKKVSVNDYQKSFKSSFFNQNFSRLFGMYGNMPMLALIYTLALLSKKDAGYPIGGSLAFSNSIEKRYLNLGGKINYNSRVSKILVEDGFARGIKLVNGNQYSADIIISAADGHCTIYNMLGGEFIDKEIESYYKDFILFPPIIQVSLGISRTFNNAPDAVTLNIPLDKPISVDPYNTINELGLKIYNYDPTLAPEGKTAVSTVLEADFGYWVGLTKSDPDKYRSEKDRLALEIIERLDKRFGNIKSRIEACDVATPYTFLKYTNNWRGSFEGFIPTVDNFGKRLKVELPGLKNFYMIGQWVQPGGGLPTGAMHGRHITQLICKRHGKEFKSLK